MQARRGRNADHTPSAKQPKCGAVLSEAVARLSVRSSKEMRWPIQITGWPIARTSTVGVTDGEFHQKRQEGERS